MFALRGIGVGAVAPLEAIFGGNFGGESLFTTTTVVVAAAITPDFDVLSSDRLGGGMG